MLCIRRRRDSFLALTALGALVSALACSNPHAVSVTVLMEEGLLIRWGDTSVLIDAFVDPRDVGKDAEAAAVRDDLLAARPPFSSISLALVSHPHREHFHVDTAGTFLRNHPNAVLASSLEVETTMRTSFGDYAAIADQLRVVSPVEGEILSLNASGIRVDFLPLNHETSIFFPEQVLGHLLYLGECKVLHVGDAEMLPENWERYRLQEQGIDIALVPYWIYKEDRARRVIEQHIRPQRVVVVQVPAPTLRDDVTLLAQSLPDVVFLTTPMASAAF